MKCEHWLAQEIYHSPAVRGVKKRKKHFTGRHRRKWNAMWRMWRSDTWYKTIQANYKVRKCSSHPEESGGCVKRVCVPLSRCEGFHTGLQVELPLKMQIQNIPEQRRQQLLTGSVKRKGEPQFSSATHRPAEIVMEGLYQKKTFGSVFGIDLFKPEAKSHQSVNSMENL